jgi:hypothetical protein
MKNKVFILLPLLVSLSAFANNDDGIDRQPLMARTSANYEKSCALQYKLLGILAQGIRDNNDEYINIAILKFTEFNYPESTYSVLSDQITGNKTTMNTLAKLAPPSVTVTNSTILRQLVNECAGDAANTLLNYKTAFK